MNMPGLGDGAKYLAGAMLAWALAQYALIPGNRFVLQPVHHDDYSNLGTAFPPEGLHTRPVSFAMIGLIASGGPVLYSVVLQGLVVACAALVLLFTCRFLEHRVSSVAAAWLFAIVFLHPRALEWGRYTGLLTNLLSAFFGLLALIVLEAGMRRPRAWLPALSGALLMLSAFSKEDYLLPFLAVALWGALAGQPRRRPALAHLAVAGVVASLLVLYNTRVVPKSFTQIRPSGPYAFVHSPAEFARVFVGYFSAPPLVAAAALAGIAFVLAALRLRPAWRGRILVLAAVPALLVVPYSFLPNHVFPYYSVSWLLWLGATVLVVASELIPRQTGVRQAVAMAAVFLLAAAYVSTRAESRAIATWYAEHTARSRRVEDTLRRHAVQLASESEVGILGAEWPGPWTMTNGRYLEKRLGLPNRWIVFSAPGSAFYPSEVGPTPDSKIEVRALDRVPDSGPLLFLVFDQRGNGVPVRHADALPAAVLAAAAAADPAAR